MQVKKIGNFKNNHKIRNIIGIKKCISWAVECLYPPCCPLCDKVLKKEERNLGICRRCQYRLVYITNNYCMKCGKPISSEIVEFCKDCKKHAHAYVQARSLLSYQGRTRESLYRLKYKNRREYAQFFSKEICQVLGPWIRQCNVEWIIPIPMFPGKERKRGYNQAQILAANIGRKMEISLLEDGLVKLQETKQQKDLTARERQKNLEAAFGIGFSAEKAGEKLVGKRILLIDDIYTTGATVDAAAKVLLREGVAAVYVLTVAIGG